MNQVQRRIWATVKWGLGIGNYVAGFFTFWAIWQLLAYPGSDSRAVALAFMLFFATILFSALAWFRYVTIRKEKYANITRHMHSIQHAIRDAQSHMTMMVADNIETDKYDGERQKVHECFVIVCNELSTAFSILTGTSCRVCIKLLYEIKPNSTIPEPDFEAHPIAAEYGPSRKPPDPGHYYFAFARDSASNIRCRELDIDRLKIHHDPLSKNLRLFEVFEKETPDWHFVHNNLPKDGGFVNTSASAYQPLKPSDSTNNGKKKSWSLPYKSTVTCAIRQGPPIVQSDKQLVLGFLCVDSESRGVFNENWDRELVFSVADSLYHSIAFLQKLDQAMKQKRLDTEPKKIGEIVPKIGT